MSQQRGRGGRRAGKKTPRAPGTRRHGSSTARRGAGSPVGRASSSASHRRPGASTGQVGTKRRAAAAERRSSTGIILSVAGLAGLMLALIVAFDTSVPALTTGSLPDIDGKGAAVELEQIRATDIARDDSAIARKRAELEQGLVDAEAFELKRMKDKQPARYADVLGKWRELIARAAGTDYASYVQTRIDAISDSRDQAAEARFLAIRKGAHSKARFGLWGECFAVIDRYPAAFREAPAFSKLSALRARYERDKKRYEQVSVRVLADFGSTPHKLERVRLLHKQNVHFARSHVKLLNNYASTLVFGFRLEKTPRPLFLRVNHLSSIHKGRHLSPITLSINGKILVGEWTPSEMGFITTRWDIAEYVRVGENEMIWQLGDARTHYWLRRFEISDWKP